MKRREAGPDGNQNANEPRQDCNKAPPAHPFAEKGASQQSYRERGKENDGSRLVQPEIAQRSHAQQR